jgi:hypothetical protein
LEAVLGRTQGRERTAAFIINILAGLVIFVLGVFGSDWVKSLPTRIAGTTHVEPAPGVKK